VCLNYETVILRRPARNVMRLARLITMVSMSRSTFLSEAKSQRNQNSELRGAR